MTQPWADPAPPPLPPPFTQQDVDAFRVQVDRLEQIAPPAVAVAPAADPPVVPSGVTNTEPVALVGSIQGVLIALLAVLQGFDVTHLSQEQVSLLLALFVALVAAGTGFARGKAWAPASVARVVAMAKKEGRAGA